MNAQKLNLAIIDDHRLFAEALQKLLARYDFVSNVSLFSNPDDFLKSEQLFHTNIVLCDILMRPKNGFEFLDIIKKSDNSLKVLFLTTITEVHAIRYAIRNGVNGYISKEASLNELIQAINVISKGETYIGEGLRNSLIRNALTDEKSVLNLSPREKEVLQHVCSGKTIREAATYMNLSINTVQTYYKTILKKFNLNRTSDLIVFAIKNGLYYPERRFP